MLKKHRILYLKFICINILFINYFEKKKKKGGNVFGHYSFFTQF